MRAWAWRVTVAVTVGIWPLAAVAADGRVEINQSVVDAAGGFPYTISSPGSYVLTGPLLVPADTDGIVIAANELTLDLNGFSITGPAACNTTVCPLGTGSAIRPQGIFGGASLTRVHNGVVRGFGGDCVRVLGAAHVENLVVSECGGQGISANVGSIVTKNRVRLTGRTGISMSASALYSGNTVAFSGLGGGGEPSFSGGRASGGNSCDDGACSPRGTRRYYLTTGQVPGNQVLTACEPGFHTASIHEIWDYSTLEYDTTRGIQQPDSGLGPPAGTVALQPAGWARTGGQSLAFDFLRDANCALWTSGNAEDFGGVWKFGNASPGNPESERWGYFARGCDELFHVWCVED